MKTTTLIATAALAASATAPAAPAAGQDMRTVSMSHALAGEGALDVHVTYGAGRLLVRPAEGGMLYALDLRYDQSEFEPLTEFDGRRLRVGIEGRTRSIDLGEDDGGELDLRLAPGVPMDLRLEFGAGRATVDLGGLALRDLDIETGASQSRIDVSRPHPGMLRRAEFDVGAADFEAIRLGNLNLEELSVKAGVGRIVLDFSGSLARDVEVDVELGLGALELRIPEHVGVRLDKESFLTSLDAEGFDRRDGVYYSSNWETSERRIRIDAEAGFGSVSVTRIR